MGISNTGRQWNIILFFNFSKETNLSAGEKAASIAIIPSGDEEHLSVCVKSHAERNKFCHYHLNLTLDHKTLIMIMANVHHNGSI